MRKLIDWSVVPFILIGLLNTGISTGIMFLLYEWGNLGYWPSTAIAFATTSVLSYFLNRRFSFKSEASAAQSAWKFALVIAACYLFAYLIARPATGALLTWIAPDANLPVEQISMLTGQVLFTGLNYLGQKFFAFAPKA